MLNIKYTFSCFLLPLLLLFYSSILTAFPQNDFFKRLSFSIAAGPSWTQVKDTHLVISPYETDSLKSSHASANTTWKVGAGYQLCISQKQRSFLNTLLIELNFYHTPTTIKGDVWQYQLPQFNNYRFRAPITSNRLLLDLKPQLFSYQLFSLYAVLGAGVAFNTASYSEVVTGAGVDTTSYELLGKKTKTNATYELGAGISAEITKHLNIFVEYIYANLGNATSSSTPQNDTALMTAPTFAIHNQAVFFGFHWNT